MSFELIWLVLFVRCLLFVTHDRALLADRKL
jgi:hypothetical protein